MLSSLVFSAVKLKGSASNGRIEISTQSASVDCAKNSSTLLPIKETSLIILREQVYPEPSVIDCNLRSVIENFMICTPVRKKGGPKPALDLVD